MSKRKYVKKEKVLEIEPIDKKMFDALLKVGTKITPPKKAK
jgi:hypothetical protein